MVHFGNAGILRSPVKKPRSSAARLKEEGLIAEPVVNCYGERLPGFEIKKIRRTDTERLNDYIAKWTPKIG